MKNKLLILSLFIIALITFGCSSSEDDPGSTLVKEGGPFEISELTGNWEATQGGFLRISDNLWVDIVADGGSLSLTVQSNGRSTFTIDPFDREVYTVSGEMFWGRYEGNDALVIVWDGSSPDDASFFPVQGIKLTSTTFDLGCTSECGEYDFNNNGNSEVADLGFLFIRN